MSKEAPDSLGNESVHIIGHERKNSNFGVLRKAFERLRPDGDGIVVDEDKSIISLTVDENIIMASVDGDKVKIGIIGRGCSKENNNQITGIGIDVSKILITSRDEFIDVQREEKTLPRKSKRICNKFVSKKPNTKGFKNY